MVAPPEAAVTPEAAAAVEATAPAEAAAAPAEAAAPVGAPAPRPPLAVAQAAPPRAHHGCLPPTSLSLAGARWRGRRRRASLRPAVAVLAGTGAGAERRLRRDDGLSDGSRGDGGGRRAVVRPRPPRPPRGAGPAACAGSTSMSSGPATQAAAPNAGARSAGLRHAPHVLGPPSPADWLGLPRAMRACQAWFSVSLLAEFGG